MTVPCSRRPYRRSVTPAAERAIAAVRRRSSPGAVAAIGVDVCFHPDALGVDGVPVLASIASGRRWRTQFESGTSNGGLTAHPGGDRWRWESRLFEGAYDGSPAEERPVYGALRRSSDPYGTAPRFGSAHLRLRPSVLVRTTLCYPDSAYEPEAVGTVDAAGGVLEAVRRIRLDDPLDRYIEAHVHGGLALDDVEAVVLDPSSRGTDVEEATQALGTALEQHPGYRLRSEDLEAAGGYRGERYVAAARRAMRDGVLTPALLGIARERGDLDPDEAKRVWHLLARFGRLAR